MQKLPTRRSGPPDSSFVTAPPGGRLMGLSWALEALVDDGVPRLEEVVGSGQGGRGLKWLMQLQLLKPTANTLNKLHRRIDFHFLIDNIQFNCQYQDTLKLKATSTNYNTVHEGKPAPAEKMFSCCWSPTQVYSVG